MMRSFALPFPTGWKKKPSMLFQYHVLPRYWNSLTGAECSF